MPALQDDHLHLYVTCLRNAINIRELILTITEHWISMLPFCQYFVPGWGFATTSTQKPKI